jgi:hypothetical protein
VPSRVGIVVVVGVEWHSPKLPQLSTVQLESVPWTVLDRN